MNELDQQRKPKSWWGAVWRGLVVDDKGTHYRMDGAIWLFLYLIIHADRRTGRLMRRYETIAADMSRPSRTIRKWMLTLRRYGYVEVARTGRSLVIHIQKWRAVSGGATTTRPEPLTGPRRPL
jgi:hypothetical protein